MELEQLEQCFGELNRQALASREASFSLKRGRLRSQERHPLVMKKASSGLKKLADKDCFIVVLQSAKD